MRRALASVASVASVVPLCRLPGKRPPCNFLNEKKSGFSGRNVQGALFPGRRHRGTTEPTEVTKEKTRCLFSERSQRQDLAFANVRETIAQFVRNCET